MFLPPCSSTPLPLPLPRFPIRFTKPPVTSPSLHYIGTTQSPSTHLARMDLHFLSLLSEFPWFTGPKDSQVSRPRLILGAAHPVPSWCFTFGTTLSFVVFFIKCSNRALTAVGSSLNGCSSPLRSSHITISAFNRLKWTRHEKTHQKKLSQRTNDGELNSTKKHILPVLPTYLPTYHFPTLRLLVLCFTPSP